MKIYFNSRKKQFSVLEKGRVICHTTSICLRNARFIVSEAGRRRVLRDKRKNVHAFIEGDKDEERTSVDGGRTISYNPYKGPHFMAGTTPIFNAPYVVCQVVDGKPLVIVL